MKTQVNSTQKQQGFTIVELLLALAVFSFVLVFVTVAFIQIFRTYTRGITRKEVNQSARFLLDDIQGKMRSIDSAAQVNTSQVSRGRICFGGYSYVWNPVKRPVGWIDNQVNGTTINIVRIDGDTGAIACKTPITTNLTVGTPTSMFSERVGIQSISLTQLGGISKLYQITISAATTQTDLLDSLAKCDPSKVGSQYCSNVTLTGTVGLRNQ